MLYCRRGALFGFFTRRRGFFRLGGGRAVALIDFLELGFEILCEDGLKAVSAIDFLKLGSENLCEESHGFSRPLFDNLSQG